MAKIITRVLPNTRWCINCDAEDLDEKDHVSLFESQRQGICRNCLREILTLCATEGAVLEALQLNQHIHLLDQVAWLFKYDTEQLLKLADLSSKADRDEIERSLWQYREWKLLTEELANIDAGIRLLRANRKSHQKQLRKFLKTGERSVELDEVMAIYARKQLVFA